MDEEILAYFSEKIEAVKEAMEYIFNEREELNIDSLVECAEMSDWENHGYDGSDGFWTSGAYKTVFVSSIYNYVIKFSIDPPDEVLLYKEAFAEGLNKFFAKSIEGGKIVVGDNIIYYYYQEQVFPDFRDWGIKSKTEKSICEKNGYYCASDCFFECLKSAVDVDIVDELTDFLMRNEIANDLHTDNWFLVKNCPVIVDYSRT